jgi:hypothetical protein
MGGGAASAFGNSGAPGVPTPTSVRGQDLATQYAADERGRFTERVFVFPQFQPLDPGGATVATATRYAPVATVISSWCSMHTEPVQSL